MRFPPAFSIVLALLGMAAVCASSRAGDKERGPSAAGGTTADIMREAFTPLEEGDARAAQAELRRAAERLDRRLATDESGGDEWREYLKWGGLRKELASEQPDPAQLDQVYARLDADYEGLDLVWFVELRLALRHYLNVRRGIDNPQILAAYEKLQGSLPARLEAYAKAPTAAEAEALGQVIGWLEDFQQARQSVSQVRERFRQPNFFVEVSRPLVAAGLAGPVDETAPIRDVILGTSIRGTGRTEGNLAVEFFPDNEDAVIDLVMLGTTLSNNVGYNGPVRIFSQGTTHLGARKRLLINGDGIDSLPSVAQAVTKTRIQGIQAVRGGGLVEKIAWRRVCRDKARAEQIASRHAEGRLNGRIDQQAAEVVGDANERFANRFRRPLWERRILPDPLRFRTTQDHLIVMGLTAGPEQLAALGGPPEPAEGCDLSVRVHESMINNAAATLLAGRTLGEEDFLKTLGDLLGEVPDRFKPDEEGKPWAVQFARREPFSVTFGDGRLEVALRATGYIRGDDEHPGMDVKATYAIGESDGKFTLTRQGDLWIFPPGFDPKTDRLSTRQTTLRRLLQTRFEKILEPKLSMRETSAMKGRWEKAGGLRLVRVKAAGGWMTLGWNLKADDKVKP